MCVGDIFWFSCLPRKLSARSAASDESDSPNRPLRHIASGSRNSVRFPTTSREAAFYFHVVCSRYAGRFYARIIAPGESDVRQKRPSRFSAAGGRSPAQRQAASTAPIPAKVFDVRIVAPEGSDSRQNGHFDVDPTSGEFSPIPDRLQRARFFICPFVVASQNKFSARIATSDEPYFGQAGHLTPSPKYGGTPDFRHHLAIRNFIYAFRVTAFRWKSILCGPSLRKSQIWAEMASCRSANGGGAQYASRPNLARRLYICRICAFPRRVVSSDHHFRRVRLGIRCPFRCIPNGRGAQTDFRPPLALRLYIFPFLRFSRHPGKFSVRIVAPDESDFGRGGHFDVESTAGGIQSDPRPLLALRVLFAIFCPSSPGTLLFESPRPVAKIWPKRPFLGIANGGRNSDRFPNASITLDFHLRFSASFRGTPG